VEVGKALVILGLTGKEFSDEDLKYAYRVYSRRTHPDLNPNDPNATAKFKEVAEAYETLKGKAKLASKIGRTEEGDLISDLGKGLGPTVNGKDCEDCKGKGYTTEETHGRKRCPTCNPGWGWYNPPCRRCNGTGRFRVNGVDRGVCNGCGGTGKYSKQLPCPTCNPKGKSDRPNYRDPYAMLFGMLDDLGYVQTTESVSYHTCTGCKGTGETKMFNPVLRKGLLGR